MPRQKWLEIAESLLDKDNLASPACAPALARSWGLDLLPSRFSKAVELVGETIVYPEAMPAGLLNRAMLGAIAEYALRREGLPVHDLSKYAIVQRLARSRSAKRKRHQKTRPTRLAPQSSNP